VALLLHGEILAFLPAVPLLAIAGACFFILWRMPPGTNKYFAGVIMVVGLACAAMGLIFLLIFLGEFRYWIQYSSQGFSHAAAAA
jgi:hypothetical protein